jgi:hypothetical protein
MPSAWGVDMAVLRKNLIGITQPFFQASIHDAVRRVAQAESPKMNLGAPPLVLKGGGEEVSRSVRAFHLACSEGPEFHRSTPAILK